MLVVVIVADADDDGDDGDDDDDDVTVFTWIDSAFSHVIASAACTYSDAVCDTDEVADEDAEDGSGPDGVAAAAGTFRRISNGAIEQFASAQNRSAKSRQSPE